MRALSIAFVNAVGNLGGFVGPYVLAAFKASLGPPCPPHVNASSAADHYHPAGLTGLVEQAGAGIGGGGSWVLAILISLASAWRTIA